MSTKKERQDLIEDINWALHNNEPDSKYLEQIAEILSVSIYTDESFAEDEND